MPSDRPPVEDVIRDLGDDALAETAIQMEEEGKRLLDMAGLALHELEDRMREKDATRLETEHWAGVLKPGVWIHTITDDLMLKLESLITPAEWAQAYVQPKTPPQRWDLRALNELVKRGGEIRATIEAARTSTRDRSKLELKRKEVA